MNIQHTKTIDLPLMKEHWDAGLAYQRAAKMPEWSAFPEEKFRREIEAGLHFSAFLPEGELAGFFSVMLADPVIWGEQERGDAIYLHRMCGNPFRKGNGFAAAALTWACRYAAESGRKFVRMDTWGDNPRLVAYYERCGFKLIGHKRIGDEPDLLPHYRNAFLALFENEAHCGPV